MHTQKNQKTKKSLRSKIKVSKRINSFKHCKILQKHLCIQYTNYNNSQLFYFLFGVQLNYNILLVCCCTAKCFGYTHISFISFPLQDIEYSALSYTVEPCCLSLIYSSLYLLPKLLIYPSPTRFPLVILSFLSVSLFLFCKKNSFVSYFRFHIKVVS